MSIKRLLHLGSAFVVSLSSILSISMPVTHAAAVTCVWQGLGITDNFSDAGNWTSGSCNGAAPDPTSGNTYTLTFTTAGSNGLEPHNDLSSASFTAINFQGGGGFAIDGNPFTVTGNITDTSTATKEDPTSNEIDANVILGGDKVVSIPQYSNLYIIGDVSGSSVITKQGSGTLALAGDNSGWTGGLIGSAGSVMAGSANALGDGSGAQSQFNDGSDLIIGGCDDMTIPADLQMTGNSTLTTSPKLGSAVGCDGDGNGFGGGGFSDEVYGGDSEANANLYMTGTITLGSDITFAGITGTTTLSGALVGAHSINVMPGYTGKLVISSSANGSSTPNGTYASVQFTKTISDTSSASMEIFDNNIISVDGGRGDTIIWSGGILKGTGTVGILSVQTGGIVAPGHSPGCMNSGDLYLSGIYQAEIGGTTACNDYDQLKVTGTVDVTNGTLSPSLYGGFVPSVGQSFTVIDNDGSADAVVGTFSGVAEGGTVTANGVTYTVTYKGGDGNDVVLTVKSINASQLPSTPDTGLKLLASNAGTGLILSMAAAGALVFVSRKLQPAKRR